MPQGGSALEQQPETRKSSDEGLEQSFNSLDAQREALDGPGRLHPGQADALDASDRDRQHHEAERGAEAVGVHSASGRAAQFVADRGGWALALGGAALGPGAALIDRELRKLNDGLSALRDAHALVETFDRLLRGQDEAAARNAKWLALLTMLMLRGPQTAYELLSRSERMAPQAATLPSTRVKSASHPVAMRPLPAMPICAAPHGWSGRRNVRASSARARHGSA